ncbi:MAG: M3 family metallopeptidase [Bacteroidetes bacterium]|nr:M3 family metallopeptidase [Bacteroidota bacterium]
MKRLFLLLIPISMLMSGYKTETNPLLKEFDTPFGVPPFHLIQESHYMPAFEEAMKQHKAEIDAIINNKSEPTFENTILAYDNAGELLGKVSSVFFGLRGANTNDRMTEIARELTPKMSVHNNEIRLNQELFERFKKVYEKRNSLNLNEEQMIVVEKIYRDFERAGAALPKDKKEKLKSINERMSMISLTLGDNLLKETNNFRLVIDNEKDLAGLPAPVIAAAADAAKAAGLEGKWVITLHNPSWIPFLQNSSRRYLREKVYKAYYTRGDNNNEFDNKELFAELMKLRLEMANILGFNNYADNFLDIQMAQKPENVYNFLNQLWKPALERAKAERAQMQDIINREGGNFKLDSWDWWYYAEKLRKEKYDLDDAELKPYFSIENVKNGNFLLAQKLFGLQFVKRPEIPVYHEEVEAYEVLEADGSHLAILYIDPHPRPGKRGGAWCGSYRSGSYKDSERISPVVTIVMNFTRPTGDQPALLTWSETNTYFHEFGHALHNFFAEGQYKRTARSVPRDFVELPSQICENWAGEPEMLKMYAFHYKNGEPIPDKLIDKISKSSHFNQGFKTVEYVAASFLDMDWHTADFLKTDKIDVNAFEKSSMRKIGLIDEIIPRYRTTYFNHIFGTGYAAGYYVYIWAGVLDSDAFAAFKESGDLFNQELASKFRKYILGGNNLYEGMDAYVRFRGKEPAIDPLLERRGLK